jgi:hypothetical protein
MSIDSTNYNLFQHTFIVTIIVGKATFAKYRVNVGGATEINLEDAYATEYELLSIKGKLPAHIANDPSRHNSSNNTPINTIVEYEIITNTHPDYISLVGNDNHTYIKITPGLTNNLTINVSIKATLTNVSYVTYTTDPVNFTIIVEPAVLGGI